MIAQLAFNLLLLGALDEPLIGPDQLLDLIRLKAAPLKSLAFVYEGQMKWVGDPKAAEAIGQFDEEFQGTFLYRADGPAFIDSAALFDVYKSNPSGGGGVIRKKGSILKRRWESSADILDSKQRIGADTIEVSTGTVADFDSFDAPNDLFPTWELQMIYGLAGHEIVPEGWDSLGGRNCLRVRTRVYSNEKEKERNVRVFWIDPERDAQVMKVDYYKDGRLNARIDSVRLDQLPLGDGSQYWLPVACRMQWFTLGDAVSKEPLYERVTSVVIGSAKANLSLPDSVFTVTRDAAWPSKGELEGAAKAAKSGKLLQKFRTQPARTRASTDPESVRKRIEENLEEADRQSKQLEASSPARQSWSGTTLVQTGLVILGISALGAVAYKKWRSG